MQIIVVCFVLELPTTCCAAGFCLVSILFGQESVHLFPGWFVLVSPERLALTKFCAHRKSVHLALVEERRMLADENGSSKQKRQRRGKIMNEWRVSRFVYIVELARLVQVEQSLIRFSVRLVSRPREMSLKKSMLFGKSRVVSQASREGKLDLNINWSELILGLPLLQSILSLCIETKKQHNRI